MPTIRQLPPSVVNKIAAGEVIERPASVVKELLENAVDAGATRIDVALGAGRHRPDSRRRRRLRHRRPSELPLAVASHATSKIADADDLFRVGTLGFRGEALASIAEVSQLTIRSRQRECEAGHELEVDRRPAVGDRPLRLPGGHDDRSPQPVLQHARPAQVPAGLADRNRPLQRGLHADRPRPSAGPLHAAAQRQAAASTCRRPPTGGSGSPPSSAATSKAR